MLRDDFPRHDEILRTRLPVIIVLIIISSVALFLQLASFQLSPDISREFALRGEANYLTNLRLPAQRGLIYDRNGEPLAFNSLEYGIGISPNLISDKRLVSTQLALALDLDEFDVFQAITSDAPWVQIARPVSAEMGQTIADLDLLGVTIDPIPKRFYPQGSLAAPVIGFVIEDEGNVRGAIGVEGRYDEQMIGRVIEQEVSIIPLDIPEDQQEFTRGSDVVLTIDRDYQYWVEVELANAIEASGSSQGTMILMDPKNGDILAMATLPTFDPNNFREVEDASLLRNAAISEVYEPGSVMKVLTVAGALEKDIITPDWTYNDQGAIDIGGIRIENSDRLAKGVVDTSQVLIQSLNVGSASISLEMGADDFYAVMRSFGIGELTGIDLIGEERGILKTPGDADWSESDLGTNSYGQGVSVTPLQMVTAFAAIANDGLMMQPRIVTQIIDAGEVIEAEPAALARPVSKETADIVTNMMIRTVNENITDAQVPGYAVAGKTGTAEIPTALGYEPGVSIVTFIGFLPADDPEVVFFVKLDRPDGYWGSIVAAPVFRQLAQRMVVLMEIPPDNVRQANTELTSNE